MSEGCKRVVFTGRDSNCLIGEAGALQISALFQVAQQSPLPFQLKLIHTISQLSGYTSPTCFCTAVQLSIAGKHIIPEDFGVHSNF